MDATKKRYYNSNKETCYLNYTQIKRKLSVEDVAYSLGYRLNKAAGTRGSYIELVLGDSARKIDTIIVKRNPTGVESWFRRNDNKARDVIEFVKENLNSFAVAGETDVQKLNNALRKLSNMPEVTHDDKQYSAQKYYSTEFNQFDFESKPLGLKETVPPLLAIRGLNMQTVQAFNDHIVFVRKRLTDADIAELAKEGRKPFRGYNIGFPYRSSLVSPVKGYEIRGANGFKGKATGTDSHNSAWIADINNAKGAVDKVFFFESALDAMAFYQMGNPKSQFEKAAFISVGGTFTDNQINNVLKQFPSAKYFDCFDNDLMGRKYGARLFCLVNKLPFRLAKKNEDGSEIVEINGKAFNAADLSVGQLSKFFSNSAVGAFKAPIAFKDWNDVLLNKSESSRSIETKYERNENLEVRRNSQLKM